jgi:hypothetical protein
MACRGHSRQATVSVVDSVGFPVTRGYAPIGVQPVESAPTPSSPAPAPAQGQGLTRTDAEAPSLVLDFSQGLSAAYVLDWRDPSTGQVLVQIPMRTAFQQGMPSANAGQVGKTVDTEA